MKCGCQTKNGLCKAYSYIEYPSNEYFPISHCFCKYHYNVLMQSRCVANICAFYKMYKPLESKHEQF